MILLSAGFEMRQGPFDRPKPVWPMNELAEFTKPLI
jgi:hypothetical protein